MSSISKLIDKWKELDRINNTESKKQMRDIEVKLSLMGYCPQKLAHINPIPKDKYIKYY